MQMMMIYTEHYIIWDAINEACVNYLLYNLSMIISEHQFILIPLWWPSPLFLYLVTSHFYLPVQSRY